MFNYLIDIPAKREILGTFERMELFIKAIGFSFR
jgi:hypothetical protein